MKTSPARLSHLTAVHMLGRILERLDDAQEHAAPSCGRRYQSAMQRLSHALDKVEQGFVVRQVLDTYSSGYRP